MKTCNRGFTLLELLIALAIMAVVLTILYQTFQATTDATRHVEEETGIYRMGHLSVSIMAEELRSAFWTQDRPHTRFVGTADSLEFTALSRHRYGEGLQGPELGRVGYYLRLVPVEPGAKPNSVLVHDEETNLLSVSSKSIQLTEMAERVGQLNFRYFGGKDWEDEWDADIEEQLPKAVEIHLVLLDENDQSYDFFTRIDIPIAKMRL